VTTQCDLRVEQLTIAFGGLTAVHELNLVAPEGRLTALIGPNGAGKTTTFNACSGLVRPTHGRVYLGDEDISDMGPAARAQRGVGRTFQRMQLFGSMTVRENVALSCEAAFAGRSLLSQVITRRNERVQIRDRTADAIAMCGLDDLTDRRVSDLSTGQRRLVDLAGALAGSFPMLLLDEPSSGLDGRETNLFGDILLKVLRERRVGILLVEHDMALVMRVCEYVYVLDFGELIFEGSTDEVRESPIVRDAYLGTGAA
jgi:ABC-type branched-subunit amino acid transport system ATPase component